MVRTRDFSGDKACDCDVAHNASLLFLFPSEEEAMELLVGPMVLTPFEDDSFDDFVDTEPPEMNFLDEISF